MGQFCVDDLRQAQTHTVIRHIEKALDFSGQVAPKTPAGTP